MNQPEYEALRFKVRLWLVISALLVILAIALAGLAHLGFEPVNEGANRLKKLTAMLYSFASLCACAVTLRLAIRAKTDSECYEH